MALKKKEIQLQYVIHNDEEWTEMLESDGVTVVDVHQEWCGPCKAVLSLFRKLNAELGDEVLHFAVAAADNLEILKRFRDKCEPLFLLCMKGKVVNRIKGANGPLLLRTITEYVEKENLILAGERQRSQVLDFTFSEIVVQESEPELPVLEIIIPEPYTIAIIKPDAVTDEKIEDALINAKVEDIKEKIMEAGFAIYSEKELTLTEEVIREVYHLEAEQPDFEDFVKLMASGPSHILLITKRKEESEPEEQTAESAESAIVPVKPVPLEKEPIERAGQVDEEEEEEEEEERTFSVLLYILDQEEVKLCGSEDCKEDAKRQIALFFPSLLKQAASIQLELEMTLALLRPALLKSKRGAVIEKIKEDGFTIEMEKEITLTEEQARLFYQDHEETEVFLDFITYMTSDPILVLILSRLKAIQYWQLKLGPTTLEEAREEAPQSFRAEFSFEDIPFNQLHGSSSPEEAKREIEFFFPEDLTLTIKEHFALEPTDKKIKGAPAIKDIGKLEGAPATKDIGKLEGAQAAKGIGKVEEAQATESIEKSEEVSAAEGIENVESADASEGIEKSEEAHGTEDIEKSEEAHATEDIEKSEEAHATEDIEKSEEVHVTESVGKMEAAHFADSLERRVGAHVKESLGKQVGAHVTESIGRSEAAHVTESFGKSETAHVTESFGKSETAHVTESFGKSEGVHVTESFGKSEGVHVTESFGKTMGAHITESFGKSEAAHVTESFGKSETAHVTESFGKSETAHATESFGKSEAAHVTESFGKSEAAHVTESFGKSEAAHVTESFGKSEAAHVTDSFGNSEGVHVTESIGKSEAPHVTESVANSEGAHVTEVTPEEV